MRRTYPDTLAGARSLVREQGIESLAAKVEAMEKNSEGCWVPDPQVEMVWGFLRYSDSQVLLVAYLEESDFEVSAAGETVLL